MGDAERPCCPTPVPPHPGVGYKGRRDRAAGAAGFRPCPLPGLAVAGPPSESSPKGQGRPPDRPP